MTLILALLLVIIVPCFLIATLVQLEPYHTVRMPVLILALSWGIISFFLAEAILDFPVIDRVDRFTETVFIAPVVEEGLKAACIVVVYLFVLVRYTGDAMIYGFAVGSGFAIVENMVYTFAGLVFEYVQTGTVTAQGIYGVAITRTITTGLIHASIGALVATIVAAIVYYKPLHAFGISLLTVLAAMLVHATYNYSLWLENDNIELFVSVAVSVISLLAIIALLNFNVRNEDHQIVNELNYDPSHPLPELQTKSGETIDPLVYVRQQFGKKAEKQLRDYLVKQGRIAVYAEHLDNGDLRPRAIRALHRAIDVERTRATRAFNQMDRELQRWMQENHVVDAVMNKTPA